MQSNPQKKAPIPLTDEQERAYHRGMSRLFDLRGRHELAVSHRFAAEKDCPKGCSCSGCSLTAYERENEPSWYYPPRRKFWSVQTPRRSGMSPGPATEIARPRGAA